MSLLISSHVTLRKHFQIEEHLNQQYDWDYCITHFGFCTPLALGKALQGSGHST